MSRETVCIKDVKSLVFFALSQGSCYFDYPLYMLLFISKDHNLCGALQRTYISEFLPLHNLHHIHTFAGKVVGFEVISHLFWHLLRWGLAGDIRLLWTHVTGVTGLVSLLVTPLIVWLMLFTSSQTCAEGCRLNGARLHIPWPSCGAWLFASMRQNSTSVTSWARPWACTRLTRCTTGAFRSTTLRQCNSRASAQRSRSFGREAKL